VHVGVLDAGVVLTRLSPDRRGHAATVRLFARLESPGSRLLMSTINLAEALHHVRELSERSGFDAVAVLRRMGVEFDAPGTQVAQRAARLADIDDLSLADRFALATALERRARLYTTDAALADAARLSRIPVTRV
jgi:predicted nucleic acid-binding protein